MTLTADVGLFRWINALAGQSAPLDATMIAAAKYAPIVFALILVGCWLTGRYRWQRTTALAGCAALLGLGLGQVVGIAFPRQRPYEVMPAKVLVPHAPDTSFPSDHATLALAVTVALGTLNRRFAWFLGMFSSLVLLARVYIGVHYPTDVLGGAVLGTLAALVVLRLASRAPPSHAIEVVFSWLARWHLAAQPATSP